MPTGETANRFRNKGTCGQAPSKTSSAETPDRFAVLVVLAGRKVLALPDGDITRLFIATGAGASCLALLEAWLPDHERRQ